MKVPFAALATLALLVPTSEAQVSCSTPGVTLEVTPANAVPGELITVTLTNNSGDDIHLPSGCLFNNIYTGNNCSGIGILNLLCPAVIVTIPAGTSNSSSWNQIGNSAMQVPDGTYSIQVQYFEQGFAQLLSCCASVTIGATGPTSLCNGNGGNQLGCTDCPCGNNAPFFTDGGCINSAGTSTRIESSGDPSVSLPSGSTSDLRIALDGAPASAFCVLNSGDALAPQNMANPCFGMNSGAQSASFDGLRCSVVNTQRHGGRSADTNGEVGVTNNPWGGEGGPPAGLANAFGGFSAGQTRYFQVTHRDDPLAVCMRGLNTSQAVEVTFTP